MTDTEAEGIRLLTESADDSQRRLNDIRAGRRTFEPGQARELFYCLRGMIERNADHLSKLDNCGADYWQQMNVLQERLSDHLDDLREFF